MMRITWLEWSAYFLLGSFTVLVVLMALVAIGKRADRRVYQDFQPLDWEESPEPPTLVCSSCGEAGPPETMRSIITSDMFRRVIHAGGCPRDRKRLRRSPEA